MNFPKAVSTLLALVQSGGRLVEKHELIKQVWPDAVVEEANLARNVWALRKALGDGDEGHVYIETIPTVGYRFVAPVTKPSVEADSLGIEEKDGPRRIPDEPETPSVAATLPSRAEHPFRPFVLTVLISLGLLSLGLMSVALVRFWREPGRSMKAEAGITFLTDGSHDDLGASWTNNGQIYFSRVITHTRVETWTMNADGTNARRANTEIKSLSAGRWSPDGKKVIFTKDGDRVFREGRRQFGNLRDQRRRKRPAKCDQASAVGRESGVFA